MDVRRRRQTQRLIVLPHGYHLSYAYINGTLLEETVAEKTARRFEERLKAEESNRKYLDALDDAYDRHWYIGGHHWYRPARRPVSPGPVSPGPSSSVNDGQHDVPVAPGPAGTG
jgi:hypothetical protein